MTNHSVDPDWWGNDVDTSSPEKNLLFNVLLRAMYDYVGENIPRPEKRSARNFFFPTTPAWKSAGLFTFICEHLAEDPDGFKEKIIDSITRREDISARLSGYRKK